MKLLNKSLTYWLRVIHRDLGYLMAGVCIVYATSGFLLNHMDGKDRAYKTVEATLSMDKGLDAEAVQAAWNAKPELPVLKKVLPVGDGQAYRLMLQGGIGVYNPAEGVVEYETHEKRPIIYWFNSLHYNRVQGWHWMGDFFAFSLAFFAISGLFLVKGKNGLGGRGKWLFLLGILIPLAYVLFA